MTRPSMFAPARRAHQRLSAFLGDARGNITLIAAATALTLTTGVGVGVDYARSTVQADEMQAATDAAALAAANAANGGASTVNATAAADKVFALDFAPSQGCGSGVGGGGTSSQTPGTPVPTVNISTASGTVTATVSYSSTMKTLFGGLIGVGCVTQSATSVAQAASAASLYSEAGGVWGDPQIWGQNGSEMMQLDCGANPSGWYNLLSDSQFEINSSCYPGFTGADLAKIFGINAFDPNMVGEYYLGSANFMIGSHVVSFSTTLLPNTPTNNPNNVPNGFGNILSVWDGSVTIDGVKYTPDLNSASSYLGGVVTGQPLTLTSALTASGHCADGATTNYICTEMSMDDQLIGLNAPYFYTITVGAYQVQLYYRFDGGRLNIWTTNAGACGTPGGAWGETLAGTFDTNSADFLVPSATYEAAQFSNTSCSGSTTQNAHLVSPPTSG